MNIVTSTCINTTHSTTTTGGDNNSSTGFSPSSSISNKALVTSTSTSEARTTTTSSTTLIMAQDHTKKLLRRSCKLPVAVGNKPSAMMNTGTSTSCAKGGSSANGSSKVTLPPPPIKKGIVRTSSCESSAHEGRKITFIPTTKTRAKSTGTVLKEDNNNNNNNNNNVSSTFYTERGLTHQEEIYERGTITTEEIRELRNDLDGPTLTTTTTNTSLSGSHHGRNDILITSINLNNSRHGRNSNDILNGCDNSSVNHNSNSSTVTVNSSSSNNDCNNSNSVCSSTNKETAQQQQATTAAAAPHNEETKINDHELSVVTPSNNNNSNRETITSRYKGIMDMEDYIKKMPKRDKVAYMYALKMSPSEVLWHNGYRLRFLRFENYNAEKAAKRYVKYWDIRKEIFGIHDFYKPMKLPPIDPMTGQYEYDTNFSCLNKDDIEHLSWGHTYVLPLRDRLGRQILYHDRSVIKLDKLKPDNLLRCQVYVLHTIMDNQNLYQKEQKEKQRQQRNNNNNRQRSTYDNQRQPLQQQQQKITTFVSISNLTNNSVDAYSPKHMKLYNTLLKDCVPMKRAFIHFINADAYIKVLVGPVYKKMIGRNQRLRIIAHDKCDTPTDVLNSLQNYGLFDMNNNTSNMEYLEKQQQKEQKEQQDDEINERKKCIVVNEDKEKEEDKDKEKVKPITEERGGSSGSSSSSNSSMDYIPTIIGGNYIHDPIKWMHKQRQLEIPQTIKYWTIKTILASYSSNASDNNSKFNNNNNNDNHNGFWQQQLQQEVSISNSNRYGITTRNIEEEKTWYG